MRLYRHNIIYSFIAGIAAYLSIASSSAMPLFLIAGAAALCAAYCASGFTWPLVATFAGCITATIVRGSIDVSMPIFSFVGIALPGMACGWMLRKHNGLRDCMLAVSLGVAAHFISWFSYMKMIKGMDPISRVIDLMQQALVSGEVDVGAIMAQRGYTINQEELTAFYPEFFRMMHQVVPTLIVVGVCILAYLIIVLAVMLVRKSGIDELPSIEGFHAIRGSKTAVFVYLFIFIIYLATKNLILSGIWMNVYLLFTLYFSLCGITFLLFSISKGVKNGFLRWIAYFLMMILLLGNLYEPKSMIVLVMIGITDAIFNFRMKYIRGEVDGK